MERALSSGAPDAKIAKFVVRQESPLHAAAKRGDPQEVERLLAFGRAEVNSTDKFGQSALHIAAFEGHATVVDVLLKKGIAISSLDKNRWSPLHAAAKEGHLAICERLLVEGADPSVTNASGTTALLYLTAHPCSDLLLFVLNLMLKRGADVNAANEHGLTPLHNACLRAGEGNVLFLLLQGASVEVADKFGETPLHVACRVGKKRVCQLLINYGATLSVIGPDGSPEQTARKYGFDEIADFIGELRRDPSKVMGKKKSSKSIKKMLKQSGRSGSMNDDQVDSQPLDASRGSFTESTGTDPEEAVTPPVGAGDTNKEKRKKRRGSDKRTESPRSDEQPPTEEAPKVGRVAAIRAPRRVASTVISPTEPQVKPKRTNRAHSGGADLPAPSFNESVLTTLTERSESPPPPVIEMLPPKSPRAAVLSPTISKPSVPAAEHVAEPPHVHVEHAPTHSAASVHFDPTSGSSDSGEHVDPEYDGDMAYSDMVSPRDVRQTRSAPSTSIHRVIDRRAAVGYSPSTSPAGSPHEPTPPSTDRDEQPEESIPFGPRKIAQHSTGVRQQKASAAAAAIEANASSDRARRARSIKIDALLKIFESTGGDVRGSTLPTKPLMPSPQHLGQVSGKPALSKRPSRQMSVNVEVESRAATRQLSPRQSAEAPADFPSRESPRVGHVQKDSPRAPPSPSGRPDRRATIADVNQLRDMFHAQGVSMDDVIIPGMDQPLGSPKKFQRSTDALQGGKSPNEALSGSSSPRNPRTMPTDDIDDDDDEGAGMRTVKSNSSLSGSKDDSVLPSKTADQKPSPLKKGGSRESFLLLKSGNKSGRPVRVDSSRLYGFKQMQPTVQMQTMISPKSRGIEATRVLPFSTHFSRINFETLMSMPALPPAPTSKPHKDDIIIPNSEFTAELGRSSDRSVTTALFAEDPDFTTPHYWDNFFTKDGSDSSAIPEDLQAAAQKAIPHFNFIGHLALAFYPGGEPIALSCINKGDTILGLCRTRAGDTTFHVEWPSDKRPQHKTVLKALLDANPSLRDAKLTRSKDPNLIAELLSYERVEKNQFNRISQHKIGVLYVKEGQTTEDQVLTNRSGSTQFEDFLNFLGKKVELCGYDGYAGGLDTKKDRSGKSSIMSRWLEFEIMFHVSTYIPLGSGEEKIMERKKHIGNDMTCLVFLDSDTSKFEPPLVSGDFLHTFIVVRPVANDPDSFKVAVTVRTGVPPFGPPLPKYGLFKTSEQFHDWLLSKMVNAERATLHSTQFISKRRLARQKLLASLVDSFKKDK